MLWEFGLLQLYVALGAIACGFVTLLTAANTPVKTRHERRFYQWMGKVASKTRTILGLPEPVLSPPAVRDVDRVVRVVEKRAVLIAQVIGAMTAASFLSLSVFAAQIDKELWRCLWQNPASGSVTNSLTFVALMIFAGAAGLFYLLLLCLLGPR